MPENRKNEYTIYTTHERFYVIEEKIIKIKNEEHIVGYKIKDVHNREFWLNAEAFDILFDKNLF